MAKNRAHALKLIMDDAQKDASSLDGMPFTGATVAPAFGNLLAMVHSLARIVETLLPEDERTGPEASE